MTVYEYLYNTETILSMIDIKWFTNMHANCQKKKFPRTSITNIIKVEEND